MLDHVACDADDPLPVVHLHLQSFNQDYKDRLSNISNLVLVKFLEDTMVQPKESEVITALCHLRVNQTAFFSSSFFSFLSFLLFSFLPSSSLLPLFLSLFPPLPSPCSSPCFPPLSPPLVHLPASPSPLSLFLSPPLVLLSPSSTPCSPPPLFHSLFLSLTQWFGFYKDNQDKETYSLFESDIWTKVYDLSNQQTTIGSDMQSI